MKKISLRTFMFVQAIVAFCIPVYYHLMVVYRLNSSIPIWIAIILLAVVSWLKRHSDVMDEYAKKLCKLQMPSALRLRLSSWELSSSHFYCWTALLHI